MQTYERLKGADGKQVFYRAERFRAPDLFPRFVAEVEIGEEVLTLSDVSMTGLGVLAPTASQWELQIGKELQVRLRLDDEILIEGLVKVCRVDREQAGVKLGLGLTSGFLDIPEIFAKRDRAVLYREIDRNLSYDINTVDPAYRQFAADVLHTLRRYRSILEQYETSNNGHAEARKADAAEALAILEERIVPEWHALWRRGNELVSSIVDDPAQLDATKRFTEHVLTPELLGGPIWRRSYEKPMGYPGDFEIMNQVYAWRSEGETAYGKLLHRIGLETCECVATRMAMIQRTIARTVAEPGREDRPARIASIGSGPAQEIVNYLAIKSLPRPVSFTLVDQERQALDQAYRHIIPQTLVHGGRAAVKCLNMSFIDLSRRTSRIREIEEQDFIYSVGLVDYLGPRRARELVEVLFDRLAPGGVLAIGNMRDAAESCLWPMEFLCDWTVHFRSAAQMMALCEGLPTASAKLEVDATGAVYVLFLRKN